MNIKQSIKSLKQTSFLDNLLNRINKDPKNKDLESLHERIQDKKEYVLNLFALQSIYKRDIQKLRKISKGSPYYDAMIHGSIRKKAKFIKLIINSVDAVNSNKKLIKEGKKLKKSLKLNYSLPEIELVNRKKINFEKYLVLKNKEKMNNDIFSRKYCVSTEKTNNKEATLVNNPKNFINYSPFRSISNQISYSDISENKIIFDYRNNNGKDNYNNNNDDNDNETNNGNDNDNDNRNNINKIFEIKNSRESSSKNRIKNNYDNDIDEDYYNYINEDNKLLNEANDSPNKYSVENEITIGKLSRNRSGATSNRSIKRSIVSSVLSTKRSLPSIHNYFNSPENRIKRFNDLLDICKKEINQGNKIGNIFENYSDKIYEEFKLVNQNNQKKDNNKEDQEVLEDEKKRKNIYKKMEENKLKEIRKKIDAIISNTYAYSNRKEFNSYINNKEKNGEYDIQLREINKINEQLEENNKNEKKKLVKIKNLLEGDERKQDFLIDKIDKCPSVNNSGIKIKKKNFFEKDFFNVKSPQKKMKRIIVLPKLNYKPNFLRNNSIDSSRFLSKINGQFFIK